MSFASRSCSRGKFWRHRAADAWPRRRFTRRIRAGSSSATSMVIYGSGRPPRGPSDVVVRRRHALRSSPRPRARGSPADQTGRSTARAEVPDARHRQRAHALARRAAARRCCSRFSTSAISTCAAGVTTAREVGGDFEKSSAGRRRATRIAIVAPRILVYPVRQQGPHRDRRAEIRAWIRDIKDAAPTA